jgi:hypothetical protein
VLIPWLGARRLLPPPNGAALLVFAAVFAALMSFANTADQVTRLTRVLVETREHDCIEGPLIASTDRGFYLADGQHDAMTLISRDDVLRAVMLRNKLVVDSSFILSGSCPIEVPSG